MLKALRQRALLLMQSYPLPRKPALRRADSDDWLLASDVPQLLPEPGLDQLLRDLAADGWRYHLQNGWLYLDHPLPAPALQALPQADGEIGCVLSLLYRHQEAPALDDPSARRALVKAAEQSPAMLERCCARLHADLAARLRMHQPLPGALLPLLACLICPNETTKER